MAGISGISSNDNNYFASMLGTKSSSSKSSSSGLDSIVGGSSAGGGLGDYALIQSGAYKKLLNAYYSRQDNTDTAQTKAEKINLSTAGSDASGLNQEITKLLEKGVSEDNRESIKEGLKGVIDKYNSLIDSSSSVDDVKVLRQALWMTQDTSALAATLSDIGITVGSNNKLSLDEEKFDKAQLTSISTAIVGRGSYFSRLADRSASISGAANNAVSGSNSSSMYRSNGSYASNTAGNVIDKEK
ncbi:MAG: hypothetical protein K6G81_05165 [Lachnospiraceae bacterium]|nr:hypothetical protein [Lachnospiraceae bacterium]